MKPLDLQSVFEWKKQAILEEITIDKKSSTRRVKKVNVKTGESRAAPLEGEKAKFSMEL